LQVFSGYAAERACSLLCTDRLRLAPADTGQFDTARCGERTRPGAPAAPTRTCDEATI
jgi:hypothetical protein